MKHEELDIEKQCRTLARKLGWVACKLEKNGCKGIPDDLFITPNGQCILVEFKKDASQKLRPEQILWAEKYPNLVFRVSSVKEFDTLSKRFETS